MTAFKIDIVSDPICPFCYLGRKRLDRAIDVYKKTIPGGSEDAFNITCKLLSLKLQPPPPPKKKKKNSDISQPFLLSGLLSSISDMPFVHS